MTGIGVVAQRKILVVDDHQLIRQSMAQVLRAAFSQTEVLEAETFAEALVHFADPALGLAVVDLSLPGMDRPRDLEKLRRARADVRIVVLSGSQVRSDILEALEAGVHGYIVKNERTEMVVARIKHVMAGEIYVPAILAELASVPPPAAAGPVPAQPKPPMDFLTPRQREVLELIGEGYSNREIGRRLDVAEGTVKMHVATIFRSIGASNRAHAAAISKKVLGKEPV